MDRMKRYVVCALITLAAGCATTAAQAQSPFDGTWKTDLSKSTFSPKPNIFYISKDWYHCVSCTPGFDVPADGQDHRVVGQPYDTIAVMVTDAHTIAITTKKEGKVMSEQKRTVSDDGKTLTVSIIDHPMNTDKTVTFEAKAKREGVLHEGAHATSGRWIIQNEKGSDDALLTTYKVNGDEITMTEPTGETYTAKFDGADYPVKGAYDYDAVELKRIDKQTIEETDKRDEVVLAVYHMTVSTNGKMMTVVEHNKLNGHDSTFVATKK
jgi:hypothetical protein